ncbi:MAG: EAL domain-containing protein [Clostridiales bacterium]|nr:EAL domain-containing protein [Clostridiales bacterium]
MSESCRKRIAVLLGQPEEYTHEQFLLGFLKETFRRDYDVCMFAMYIKYQQSPARCIGETSIFRLPSYDKFDAVVVLADTIQTEGEISRIEEELHRDYQGPVLFIDKDSQYFPSLHIDNVTPEKAVIDHLIEKHGFRDIAFLTGKSWHPHSKIRLKAYKDSLTEHGIEVDENRIFFGDFWYTSGASLVDSLLSEEGNLPQAIACANDYMALGVAKRLTERGLSIPGDIAVVGCDGNEEGRHAPIPITSASLSAYNLGQNAALLAHSYITGEETEHIDSENDLFIGESCGCSCESARPVYYRRADWDTEMSSSSMFSPVNHMDEDLLAQTSFTGLISTIFVSLHHVSGFESFNLCLNPALGEAGPGFEQSIKHVIRCGTERGRNDRILTASYFDRSEMLPELYEKRDKPAAFLFMPLYYEECVFGYAAISYGDRLKVITPEYRAWLKSVSRGIECYKRADALIGSSQIAKKGITTDQLTGLANYLGFLEQTETLMNRMRNNGGYMGALAIDIKELSRINDTYGRKAGNNAIITTASVLEKVFSSRNCLCIRVGNDELVAIRITSSSDDQEMLSEKDKLLEMLKECTGSSEEPYTIDLYYGVQSGSPSNSEEIERLVNLAISKKNADKANAKKLREKTKLSEEELREALAVSRILDDNKIGYHFQPIVDVNTCRIYAYEALMRPDVTPHLSPLTVLRYAEYYGRLYDVEKATFHNVISIMKKNETKFLDGKKIFINSIPGCLLSEEDMKDIEEYVSSHPDSIVVELTEHSEASDETLRHMKQTYERIGIKTAVDDFGTGYSNVSNLLRYIPNYVKIDRALISMIEESPQKRHFVRDIIEFSHENGILALAEGVETEEELKTVIMLGVDLVQGYYTARPEKEMVQSIRQAVADTIRTYAAQRNQNAGM